MNDAFVRAIEAELRGMHEDMVRNLTATSALFDAVMRNRPEPVLDFSADVFGREEYPHAPLCDCPLCRDCW